MSTHRSTMAMVSLVGSAPLFLVGVAAGPAEAHGAPTDPISRAVACSQQGGHAGSAACAAAAEAGGSAAFEKWDNIRVADVEGRDRTKIPDGELCSAGIDPYKGLDVARADWPASTLEAGEPFTLTYASTIPHRGTFSVYLTKDGYDPNTPLSWDDLANEPFVTATDPVLQDGAYRIKGTLPGGRTGRHLIYTIWRNTDTPDTYYSCSDIVVTDAGSTAGDEAQVDENTEASRSSADAEGGPSAPGVSAGRPTAPQPPKAPASSQPEAAAKPSPSTAGSGGVPLAVTAAAAALVAVGAVAGGRLRRRWRTR
ncbi:lytic polysaccharide monooxygenase auxiliary activity family 9 protein [Streptomyces sp. NPDC054841]